MAVNRLRVVALRVARHLLFLASEVSALETLILAIFFHTFRSRRPGIPVRSPTSCRNRRRPRVLGADGVDQRELVLNKVQEQHEANNCS